MQFLAKKTDQGKMRYTTSTFNPPLIRHHFRRSPFWPTLSAPRKSQPNQSIDIPATGMWQVNSSSRALIIGHLNLAG
jgi:hypothetical protein